MFRRILTRGALGLLVVFGVGLLLWFSIVTFGRVDGQEFAPDTFERRHYWYYELPLVRWKISPVFRRIDSTQLEQMLVNNSYVSSSTPPGRWDLVAAWRLGRPWRQGDARILCDYLDAYDPHDNLTSYWETWTNDHPKLAKILWPNVAELARKDVYWVIPRLFEISQEHEDPLKFQEQVDQLLAGQYALVAATEAELGNLSSAVALHTAALEHQPLRVESLEGRASCHELLGEPDKAAKDRNVIVQLQGTTAERELP